VPCEGESKALNPKGMRVKFQQGLPLPGPVATEREIQVLALVHWPRPYASTQPAIPPIQIHGAILLRFRARSIAFAGAYLSVSTVTVAQIQALRITAYFGNDIPSLDQWSALPGSGAVEGVNCLTGQSYLKYSITTTRSGR
jgi:hypothetical protein